jgi:titin
LASRAATTINDTSFNAPNGIATDSSYVWVANESGGPDDSGSVSKINIVTDAVTEIDSSSFNTPYAISSDGSDVWVVNQTGGPNGTGSVSKIDIATGAVTEIDSPSVINPYGISSDGTSVWVANDSGGTYGNGSVSKIDIATGAVTEIDSPSFNSPNAIASDGTNVWVTNGAGGSDGNGSVSKIDIATGDVTEINSSSFNNPYGVSPNGTSVWVANGLGGTGQSGSVSKIAIATGVVTEINSPTFDFPDGIASNSTNVWVVNSSGGASFSGSLSDINAAAGTTSETDSSSFSSPVDVALTAGAVWVTNPVGGINDAGSVTKITLSSSPGTGSTTTTVPKVPTALHASAGAGSATLSWHAPSSTGGSPATNYVATSHPGSKKCTTTKTSCTISGLTSGVSYYFTVVARNEAGASKSSNPSNKVKPKPKPTNPCPIETLNCKYPYAGSYSGTIGGTLTIMTQGEVPGAPSVGSTTQIDAPIKATVTENVVTNLYSDGATSAYGQSVLFWMRGQSISNSGAAHGFEWGEDLVIKFGSTNSTSDSDLSCSSFSLQFNSTGVTTTASALCTGTDNWGDTVQFLASFNLSKLVPTD